MPRTPLLRSLFQLARDHEEADTRQVPVETVRQEREASAEVSRRTFLATIAAGAAAATLLPKAAWAAGGPRIAIVGGGISGLACALQLADSGLASTVYESKGRTGGRMFSDMAGTYWADGQVSEWCGELVDTGHKTIHKLCQRFGLSLDDLKAAQPNQSTDTNYFGGAYYTTADKDFAAVKQALKVDLNAAGYPTRFDKFTSAGHALDQMSLYDWIETRVPGGHQSKLGQLIDVAYVIEYGAETTDQSALNLVYLLGYQATAGNFQIFGASDERYHIRGGNQRLPEAIATYLGKNAVKCGYRMTQIARNADLTFTLTFAKSAGGVTTVVADAVILALPFAVLRKLDYSLAGFDALKDTAIQQLGRSQNGKLMVQFNKRLWNDVGPWGKGNGSSYSDTGYQAAWDVSRAQPGNAGILVGYSGGSVTVDTYAGQASPYTRANDAKTGVLAKQLLAQMEPVYPGLTATANGKAELSIPPKDPDLLLAYSYFRVGQYTQFAGYEKAPQGHCYFAGEHCSQDFQGFMEGGASEGIRAATEVVAAFK
jgi:monoamine oxidase